MGQPDGGTNLINVLTAMTAGAVGGEFNVLGTNVDLVGIVNNRGNLNFGKRGLTKLIGIKR